MSVPKHHFSMLVSISWPYTHPTLIKTLRRKTKKISLWVLLVVLHVLVTTSFFQLFLLCLTLLRLKASQSDGTTGNHVCFGHLVCEKNPTSSSLINTLFLPTLTTFHTTKIYQYSTMHFSWKFDYGEFVCYGFKLSGRKSSSDFMMGATQKGSHLNSFKGT